MWRIFGFFVLLSLAASLTTPAGSLASIPLQFYLKDTLKQTPEQQATYSLLVSIPLYGAFLFGLMRDRLNAIGIKDRQYFLVAAPIIAAIYVVLAFFHASYAQILIGVLAATLAYRVIAPAVVALQATVGKGLKVTGWMSVVVLLTGYVLGAILTKTTGWLQELLTAQQIFFLLAACACCLLVIGLRIPRTVAKIDESPPKQRSFAADLKVLLSHKGMVIAALMYLAWEFSPSTDTALFNHLTDTVHLSNGQYYDYRTITQLAFIPGALLYGLLGRRVKPRKLIMGSLILGVPQAVPLILIQSPFAAYAAGIWYGATGGMASAAVYELLLRASPAGFEGFAVELGATGAFISGRLGNFWGSKLLMHGGFALTNWVTTAVYALIPIMFLFMPDSVLSKPETNLNAPPGNETAPESS